MIKISIFCYSFLCLNEISYESHWKSRSVELSQVELENVFLGEEEIHFPSCHLLVALQLMNKSLLRVKMTSQVRENMWTVASKTFMSITFYILRCHKMSKCWFPYAQLGQLWDNETLWYLTDWNTQPFWRVCSSQRFFLLIKHVKRLRDYPSQCLSTSWHMKQKELLDHITPRLD